jgi:hypothetical protein
MGLMRHTTVKPSCFALNFAVRPTRVAPTSAVSCRRVALTSAACQSSASLAVSILLLIVLAGCGGSSTSPGRGGTGGNPTATGQQRSDILAGTMQTIFTLEDYEFGQAEPLVMSRLNQWLRGQELKISWQREPRLDELSAQLASLRGVRTLADNAYLYDHDFEFLREAVWMRRISEHLRGAGYSGESQREDAKDSQTASNDNAPRQSPIQFVSADDPEELRLAMQLFDWTVANVQLEDDAWPEKSAFKLPRNWHTPYETVLLGRGTASDRAWTFILLARQQGLDVVLLGIGDAEKPAELKPWVPALVLAHGDGDKKELDLYLFDPALGLPIPGPDGRGIATLAQVAADESLLRQLDLNDQRPYPIKAADIQQVTALVEASPGYLSRRMKFLESKLGGKHRLVLSVSPQALQEKLAETKHVRPSVALWTRPYETLVLRQSEDDSTLRNAQRELAPLTELLDRAAILSMSSPALLNHPAIKLWLNLSITREEAVRRMAADGIPENEITAALSEATKGRTGVAKATSRREDSPEWAGGRQRPASQANPRVSLGVGRMLQLAGNYDHESGAIYFLLQAMASQSEQDEIKRALADDLRSRLPRPDDPATRNQIEQIAAIRVADYRRADEAAKLWIGQIKTAQGEFEPAIDYFKRWQNELWQPSFNYSLARVYEAQGNLHEAIALYREDDSPQRHGNLLRARRLEKIRE